jgi:hypothetical protein
MDDTLRYSLAQTTKVRDSASYAQCERPYDWVWKSAYIAMRSIAKFAIKRLTDLRTRLGGIPDWHDREVTQQRIRVHS